MVSDLGSPPLAATDLALEIGQLKAKVDGLEAQVAELRVDVKSLLALADKGRGGWLVLAGLSMGVASIVTLFARKLGLVS